MRFSIFYFLFSIFYFLFSIFYFLFSIFFSSMRTFLQKKRIYNFQEKKMFLFLEFVLDNVLKFTDVFELCLTCTESIDFMRRYYVCHAPIMIPFDAFKINRRAAHSWHRFIDHVLSRPLFWEFSNFRMSLCVLLDFLDYTSDRITTIPNPRSNIAIRSKYVNYECGYGCYSTLLSGFINNTHEEPFHFTLHDRYNCSYEEGIVFREDEYLIQKYDYLDSPCKGDAFKKLYEEEFYVVHTSNSTWIIVFLFPYENDSVQKDRNKLQNRFAGVSLENDNNIFSLDNYFATRAEHYWHFTDRFLAK
jgi:hypothetical protein